MAMVIAADRNLSLNSGLNPGCSVVAMADRVISLPTEAQPRRTRQATGSSKDHATHVDVCISGSYDDRMATPGEGMRRSLTTLQFRWHI